MPNLSENFRESFLAYSKNPHNDKNKANLVNYAFAIFEDAVNKCGMIPDEYLVHIFDIIKPAIQGIKVNPDLSKILDDFIRDLSFSELKTENQAFHVLNLAYNLTSPKKSCLREVIKNFLILQEKLTREDFIITNRNFAGSFFLNNLDVSNVREKKSVIDNLVKFVSDEVFNKSREDEDKFFPCSYNVNEKIQHIEKHIDSLSEKQCEQILSGLLQKINPILHAQSNPDDVRGDAENMTDFGKKRALKIHSFNDKWFFTFLAKIVKTIQETLGIKTTAERLLENLVADAKNAGVTLK